ncbi:hypothetical protein NW762_005390 [Fusarium torreyae]|uniref:Zn(2)-C6 fungal-type domain-containing protein n=1 Tax=Fusarium torreyae TaxID=1237075 RepID=A0A9W8S413_9HYPO|nr:hypothetical protein NW762_005390 [Fusarium torreyae]
MENLSYQAFTGHDTLPDAETQSGPDVAPTPHSPLIARKRSSASANDSLQSNAAPSSLRKSRKVSRACDFCKSRKAKCSGDQPCAKCAAKGLNCLYDSKYTRGRPPTPPPSETHSGLPNPSPMIIRPRGDSTFQQAPMAQGQVIEADDTGPMSRRSPRIGESTAPSRASPELSITEIQGQVFDPTSGLTFLHRALKRLSDQRKNVASDSNPDSAEQTTMAGGDKALPPYPEDGAFSLPEPVEARLLLSLYFDVCIATYRILHRPTVESWLSMMERNMQNHEPVWKGLGRAKAAIVLVALAIASLHRAKSEGFLSAEAENQALASSDTLFTISTKLVDEEMGSGFPKLESAQAKLIQVLYLLTTSRFNRGWYTFGSVLQLVSALGLHRRLPKRGRVSTDYMRIQCGIRTFWTAYILDNYLGVIFGRPRHFHDDDIDQDYPDRVDDDAMTPTGPQDDFEEQEDCVIDALIFHAK